MKSMTLRRGPASIAHLALLIAIAVSATLLGAQAPQRFVGSITAISGTTLTVKTDAGQEYQVVVPGTAAIRRIAPGEKDLSVAATIQFSDLAVGDRALVRVDPDAPAGTVQATQIIAVKQSDLALKQQKDREDWQLRGVGGMVKSVDSAAGVIVLGTGAGSMAKTITVHTSDKTILKRYAPGSVRFDAAQPAPIDEIHPGDQLRARGTKNETGTEINAEEVVSGSFRNIAGTISSVDAAGSTLVVKDLATKKQVTIHVTADAQMRRLPDGIAQMLAMRLKGTTQATIPVGQLQNGAAGMRRSPGQGAGRQGAAPGGDLQQMLSRAPQIQLSDLKKNEAVMLVSTEGTAGVTAITLLAGVEPLLESPAASQDLLSSWSMGGNSAGASEAAQ
jgi:hypothetical protein